MRELTEAEIQGFASQPNTQSEIVKKTLSVVGPNSTTDIRDLFFAAKLQGWSKETIQAILAGIAHARTPHRPKRERTLPLAVSETTMRKTG